MKQKQKGIIFILSGPLGSGKTTIAETIFNKDKNVKQSISATTRKPRPGEKDGKHYYFKTHDEFEKMIKTGELLEHEYFLDNGYGTPKAHVQKTLEDGKDILLVIDQKGVDQVVKYTGGMCVSIFLMPPSMMELKRRLIKRGDTKEDIKRRMEKSEARMKDKEKFDYCVINDTLENAVKNVESIIVSERLRVVGSKRGSVV